MSFTLSSRLKAPSSRPTAASGKTPAGQAAAKTNARTPAGKPEVRIFVSYSHFDAAARTKLETHLAPLVRDGVLTWFDGNMDPGDPLDASISKALKQAHVLVALLSPEYISSRYCQIEYERAMARRARGTMRVVAVPVAWRECSPQSRVAWCVVFPLRRLLAGCRGG